MTKSASYAFAWFTLHDCQETWLMCAGCPSLNTNITDLSSLLAWTQQDCWVEKQRLPAMTQQFSNRLGACASTGLWEDDVFDNYT